MEPYTPGPEYQSNPEKKEQTRRHNPLRLRTILQSYNNQISIGIGTKTHKWINETEQRAQKQTHTPTINL